ncbi:aryl-alcohol dehydrogenase-like predicted oxidoreductase [Branchiibius hedensis]|uniref:Predicted oxidoreductase n=1 Tax=Branchiibius hedensis TaxID=672460 RepID=A0A2Y8ZNH7_9MICO|nr:aldo/keto reductase [Branchiibius hedensis]PWJ25166.1 aryl-alcohol dehydrogenase-like predicted oxidoreductase [Branchiibius hedensis]SSA33981.1 Predicted oxidoreductase [Branchiibius hedensis]
MRIQPVGDSGLRVSSLTLGTSSWGRDVDLETARDLLTDFRSAGGTTIDTAAGYADGGAERVIGALIKDLDRDGLRLVGKAGITGGSVDTSRGALLGALDASLDRLGVDYLDLWLVHTWDSQVPLAETMSAMEAAHRSGRARYVGVSNYSGWQFTAAASMLREARIPLVANEIEYNLLTRSPDAEVIPAAQYAGAGILAWAPLAGGILTGKYRHGTPADSRAAGGRHERWAQRHLGQAASPVVNAVVTAADGLEVSPAEVALAWTRDRVASSIIGARTTTQLAALLRSEELTIPDAVRDALDEVSAPRV